MKVVLKDVRCSYVFVKEPRKADKPDAKDSYSIQVIIPKNDPQVAEIKKATIAIVKEKFPKVTKLSMLKTPLRDGDDERDSPEYEGCYFLNANSYRAPGIVNRKGKIATEADLEELCYSGAYFHVSINLYGFDRDGSKGVAAGLNNVMLRKAGERLDGSINASDEFAEFADGDDDLDDFDDL